MRCQGKFYNSYLFNGKYLIVGRVKEVTYLRIWGSQELRAVAHKGGSAFVHKGDTAAIRITCLPCDKNMVDIPEKLLVTDGFSHNGIKTGAQRALDGVKGVPIGVVVRVLRQPV